MSFLSKFLNINKSKKEAFLSVLGPSMSGKTTLIRFLETGEHVLKSPLTTLGMEYREKPVQIGKWKFSLIDVGGQEAYREIFWELAIQEANGVLYMVDASIRPEDDIFDLHRRQFEFAMKALPEDIPCLILLNKQDLDNPISMKEFTDLYPLDVISTRTIKIYPTRYIF